MRFYKELYVSEGAEKKKNKILRKLKRKKFPLSAYLIVLPQNTENQLEILSAVQLYQTVLEEENLFVIGIATDQDDAVLLVQTITQEVLEKTGDVKIRAYIEEKIHT